MLNNWLKTSLLMAAIVALFGTVGMLLGGAQGMLIALLLGGAMNLWAYWNSDKMVLRQYHAQEVDAQSGGEYYAIVQELAQRAALPMPKVYIIDEAQPNAFATGRNPEHAAVAATRGILAMLSARELRGVMAHELTHVKNRDILTSTISATVAGAISTLAQFGMFFGGGDRERPNFIVQIAIMILAPLAAMLIQMAISRAREFGADRGGAEISGDPESLASALRRIEAHAQGTPMAPAEMHPETAQMMIVNPLTGGDLSGLFRTHPATEERVSRLLAMAKHGV
ncbi:MAG: protease HtpX [Hydrogenophilales bacterium CG03_land_8_20_14_0_80_62_28]|nr:zinc metalloprotease HtpX [Betaproteobacteria bacterium]OIO78626.1 MAG: protease HtpX [Hydrogenophilaceae bacterium CG1_02_62_390]PIV22694.1 MAG: protease HtpX [Hydrogenophilales bacterium CG03_land_8_20_14_0_80_62_28]PIW39072.1 MAG: protease HtpX [Hydrogenophilales bacterium CG15_BIG_FIL_POST_REV_8_21_14_020_62_31]PIW72798.1 MAG: protease HtpX [Hydrogenophilales bacterium CG12_big_fil_rev_8_21_14_0_65_61_21]PIX01391.1 MAG: protease HtpX [Hydrogenophilales bacterium CG_4_8_14_3_um_filter_62